MSDFCACDALLVSAQWLSIAAAEAAAWPRARASPPLDITNGARSRAKASRRDEITRDIAAAI